MSEPRDTTAELEDPLSSAAVLRRYRRAMRDGQAEHQRLLDDAAEYYQAYGLNSIQGRDFADLQKVWSDHPPEVGILLSNVNSWWGSLIASRREPTFPGFDQGAEDEVTGEMLTMLVKAGRRWAGSDAVDEAALMDQIIVGVGFAEQFLETEERPPYRTRERHITLDRVWWDTGSREKNLKDAQEFIVRYPYSIEEAAARFPDHADVIRALGRDLGSGGGKMSAPGEGARSLGGQTVSVSVSAADGSGVTTSGAGERRLREVPVDDFQFLVYEQLVSWEMPDPDDPAGGPIRSETTREVFDQAMEALEQQAAKQGEIFQRPPVLPYASGTWYRARILAASLAGEPRARVLVDAAPIPGNQPLVRALTGYPELYKDGESLKKRYFGWGRVLLGLQRLTSVAIRVEIEQEARRNRNSASIEADAFPTQKEFQAWVDATAIPGAKPMIPPGAWEKIHWHADNVGTRVSSMKEMFSFFAIDLPAHMLGISDINRGTFQGDRSARFLATMQEASSQMQTHFTSSFTDYLSAGAVTMARLMLLQLDAEDIDRLLGAAGAKLREGVNAQKDPETGELVPIEGMTTGSFLKSRVGELFDNDVGFALRPSAASERAANAALMSQHGVFETLLTNVPEEARQPVLRAFLRGSFAQGTAWADLDNELEGIFAKLEAQQEEQAKAQTAEGWLQFLAQTTQTDYDQAVALMKQAQQILMGPQAEPS